MAPGGHGITFDILKERLNMDEATIAEFEKVEAQLEGLHEEIGVLSKKRPDDKVNKWKLKFANRV